MRKDKNNNILLAFSDVTSKAMLRHHRHGIKRRALVAAAAAAVSPVPAQRKARAEAIKSARESARTGLRDAAAARRAAHKRRRGPLFSSLDSPGVTREVKEARRETRRGVRAVAYARRAGPQQHRVAPCERSHARS